METPTPNEMIRHFAVEGPDIYKMVWERLMPAVLGERQDVAIVGMLSLSTLLMKEDATLDQLRNAVNAATQAIVNSLATPQGSTN